MKSLYEKINLGGIELRNRFVRSGTHEGLSPDGSITEDVLSLYRNFAREDVGLIITSGIEVTEDKVFDNSFRLNNDECIKDMKNLVDIIHSEGGKVMAQLFHGSSFIFLEADYVPLAPSAVKDRFTQIVPKEMTQLEIKEIIKRFADAAYRSKKAGFDGVQVQASAGFLINKFFSPYYNQRQDEYGGDVTRRSRIAVEIRKAIADKCGNDFPVFIKMSMDDLMKEDVKGLEFSDGKELAKILSDSGYNAIETIAGVMGETMVSGNYNGGEPFFKEKIVELASEVKVPVIANGGIRTEKAANELISNTNVDGVSFARPFIADADLVKRFKNGHYTKCTTCFQCNGPNGVRCIKNK
ncbi:MAG: tRNA-dihydrouridine synthase [Firmicutes bacterium]|jgi:2,4-dienoyl-CoA reductase-like NADH-dependent reductase (Old Yellow Enzyme family)|nr:tRNA-dihydrouridine synthase [Bacillota bacterium]